MRSRPTNRFWRRVSHLRFDGSCAVCKLACTCMFVYLLQAVARIDSGSGQASNNLPTAHPLLVRQTDGNLPGQSGVRSRGVPVRNRSYRVGNPQTLVHFIENSGRTSRLGHTPPSSILHRFATQLTKPSSLAAMRKRYARLFVAASWVRPSQTRSTSRVRRRRATLASTSSRTKQAQQVQPSTRERTNPISNTDCF